MSRNIPFAFALLMMLMMASCGDDKASKIGQTEVIIETSKGKITLRLYDDTPQHRDNFIRLAEEGAYDGIIWHRIVNDGIIQSGDPRLKARGEKLTVDTSKYDYTIPAEIVYPRHYHKYGALAAARENDDINPQRRSSGTQFYIVCGKVFQPGPLAELHQLMKDVDTLHDVPPLTEQQKRMYTTKGGSPHLDGQYTVFGEVVDGMKVVEAIDRMRTDEKEHPLKEVSIRRVTVRR